MRKGRKRLSTEPVSLAEAQATHARYYALASGPLTYKRQSWQETAARVSACARAIYETRWRRKDHAV